MNDVVNILESKTKPTIEYPHDTNALTLNKFV